VVEWFVKESLITGRALARRRGDVHPGQRAGLLRRAKGCGREDGLEEIVEIYGAWQARSGRKVGAGVAAPTVRVQLEKMQSVGE